MKKRVIPPLSPSTVEWLDHAYPDRCPNPSDTDREIWMKAGERRLVSLLKTQLQKQENPNVSP